MNKGTDSHDKTVTTMGRVVGCYSNPGYKNKTKCCLDITLKPDILTQDDFHQMNHIHICGLFHCLPPTKFNLKNCQSSPWQQSTLCLQLFHLYFQLLILGLIHCYLLLPSRGFSQYKAFSKGHFALSGLYDVPFRSGLNRQCAPCGFTSTPTYF